MERRKRSRLEGAGWRVGAAADFLELSAAEAELVEMKHALSAKLRKAREDQELTQVELARRMGSSQSRVAKMEAGDPGVTLDLLIQGLLAVGASRKDIASAITTVPRKKASGE
jgi:DNA-binding XRE family transcriptional regulator